MVARSQKKKQNYLLYKKLQAIPDINEYSQKNKYSILLKKNTKLLGQNFSI